MPEMISVIIPFFNEEGNVAPLIKELVAELRSSDFQFEIICIDDGSTDNTRNELLKQSREYPEVKLVAHKSNFGQSAAYATGFLFAKGNIAVTMDGDMQYYPEDLLFLVQELKNHDVDAVCGIRKNRKDKLLKKIPSKLGNILRRLILKDHITDMGCTLRAIKKEVLKEIPVFNGMHRFLPSILRFQGYRVLEREVRHRPRLYGKSKYGIWDRLFGYFLDCFGVWWLKRRSIPGHRIKG